MSMHDRLPVEERHFSTAPELAKALLEVSKDWGPPDFASPWVYRGHADASWALKPSAWRSDGQAMLAQLARLLRPRIQETLSGQVGADSLEPEFRTLRLEYAVQTVAEVVAVRQFCDMADELGLEIPGGDAVPALEEAISLVTTGRVACLLGQRPLELEVFGDVPFAFAQHHGIPTRYQDWTRNPLVAAFFAAEGVQRLAPGDQSSGELCIWATTCRGRACGLTRWVEVPRSRHHFLHAQSGLFSFDTHAQNHFMNHGGQWPAFGEGVLVIEKNSPLPPLRRYSLPRSEALSLLLELFRRRVSLAHLMPTFDNVAAAVQARWSWYPENARLCHASARIV